MHVIAFEHEPSTKLGGQELNLFEISKALTSKGHRLSLVYTKPGNLLKEYGNFCDQLIQVKQYGPKRKNIIGVIFFFLNLISDLRRIEIYPDSVLFCNDPGSVLFASLLGKIRGVPVVQYLQLPGTPFKIKWRPGLFLASRMIAVSQATKHSWVDVLDISERKIEVVYNGPDIHKFQPAHDVAALRRELAVSDEAFVLLFIGRLNPSKGIEVLIKAFGKLLQKSPQSQLLIAGIPILEPEVDSPSARVEYQRHLERLSCDVGAAHNIRFLGHMSDTPMLYQASDVTVLPSIWPDPCPRVTLESMASGTPFVGSRTGGIPEQLTSEFDDWLCTPGDEDELCHTLLKLQNWRQINPDLQKRCRQHVLDNFSPETMMAGIERILFKVSG